MESVYLTPGGLRRLMSQIESTRAAFQAVSADMPAALESGDTSGWHDNFAFEENQRQMHQLARRIRDLEAMLGRVRVVDAGRAPGDRVAIGAQVTWQVDDEEPRSAWIAGYGDGDPRQGRISYDSPMGHALIGARVGEVRAVLLGGQTRDVEILAVRPGPEDA